MAFPDPSQPIATCSACPSQKINPWQSDCLALASRSGLYRPATGRIFFKAQIRSVIVLIFEIRTKNAYQVSFVQDDDTVRALSPY